MIANRFGFPIWGWVLSGCLLAGCGMDKWGRSEKPTTRPAGTLEDSAPAVDERAAEAMAGTIGAEVYLEGNRFMRVRGVGLVTGLNGNGSRYCPPSVRDYLAEGIRRSRLNQVTDASQLSAEELIDSLDTAVVEVTGEIPAGMAKGGTFDVFVSASAISPDTRSLVGGELLLSDLNIFHETSPGEIVEGKTHAKCRGPVLINPFALSGDDAAGTSLLEGRVIGGGLNLLDRRLSLNTLIESYALAGQITDAIRRRFPEEDKVADAAAPNQINLQIPESFRGREDRFIETVMHLPLSPIAAVRERQAAILIGELAASGPPPEDAALSLEGIGPSVISLVQELYTHPRRQVNYYAARTGLRLGDELAIDVVIRHAKDSRSPFRFQAIRELGNCRMSGKAGVALRELVDLDDSHIRILAYESLRKVDHASMLTALVGAPPGNFVLDVVPADGRPLVYARRTGIRRIALIGANLMTIRPPLFYSREGSDVTLSAKAGDTKVTILRKADGSVAGKFAVDRDDLVLLTRFMGDDPGLDVNGKPRGLGLDYAVVLDVLYHLCRTGAINGEFKWEEESVEDLIGPLRPMGRPESEL